MNYMHSLIDAVDFGIPQMYIWASSTPTGDIETMVNNTYGIYAGHTSERVVAGQSAYMRKLDGTADGRRVYTDEQVINRLNIWLEAVIY